MTDLKMFEKDKITGKKKYIPGSWRKLFKMNGWALMCVIVIVFNFYMFNPVSEECKEAISDPCSYCSKNTIPILINYSGNYENMSSPEFNKFYEEIQRRPYEQ
jgi:hypothetical protein